LNSKEFKDRTKGYALAVIRLVKTLPRELTVDVMGRQLVRCATSVGANYRAACRAKSAADFVAKMGIVEEEADESLYWLELLIDSGTIRAPQVSELMRQGEEILAMTVSSIKTSRTNARNYLKEEHLRYEFSQDANDERD
jgi:four helix bundle protein